MEPINIVSLDQGISTDLILSLGMYLGGVSVLSLDETGQSSDF